MEEWKNSSDRHSNILKYMKEKSIKERKRDVKGK